MTTQKPESICGGPVDDLGRCPWCKMEHLPTRPIHIEGKTSHHFPKICDAPWPDRPTRTVEPMSRQVVEMRIDCWQCKASVIVSGAQHPDLVQAVANGHPVRMHCNQCGAGIDLQKRKIVSLGEGRQALLNNGPNRHQRRNGGR